MDPDPATVTGVGQTTMHRWMVNYLRHARTSYDTSLDDLYARVGRAIAADVIRDRVLAAIAHTYPALATEARRHPLSNGNPATNTTGRAYLAHTRVGMPDLIETVIPSREH